MKKLHLTLRIIKALLSINQFNYTGSAYHRMAKKLTERIFSNINLHNSHPFPDKAKLKMQWYMADSIFACEQFNILIGNSVSKKNRETYLLSGALLTMCDMIIDDVDMDMNRINLLKRPSADFSPNDPIEKLYLHCYHLFFNSVDASVKERTKNYFELVFDAQVKSKEQFNPEISREEVDAICKAKCGYCTLLFRSLLSKDFDVKEEPLWYELGGLVQYCNDTQDLHKDLKNKIKTFASTRPEINLIKQDLEKQKIITFDLIKAAPFDERKKDDFILIFYIMYLAILAKLEVFLAVCNFQFTFNTFLTVDSKVLYTKTAPVRLLSYILPKAYDQQYL